MLPTHMTERNREILTEFCKVLKIDLDDLTKEFKNIHGSEYIFYTPEEMDFNIMVPVYWFCVDYNYGKRDILYKLLCEIDYTPSVSFNDITDEDERTITLYDWFVKNYF